MKKLTEKQVVEKWNKTGLLDDIKSKNDLILLSQNLEKAHKKLLKVRKTETEDDMEIKAGLFLPIIVRLFDTKKVRVIKNIHQLYQKFDRYFDKNYQMFVGLRKFHDIDAEAEFCGMFIHFYEEL